MAAILARGGQPRPAGRRWPSRRLPAGFGRQSAGPNMLAVSRRLGVTACRLSPTASPLPVLRRLHVLQHPAPELREPCRDITPAEFDGSLYPVAEEMLRLMIEHDGVGLAAPQVGLPLRLILIAPCATGDHRHTLVLANPVLLGESAREPLLGQPGVELGPEGCLSIEAGDTEGLVPRWREVRCAAQTLDGDRVEVSAVGYGARVLQHEIDHLNGVLFIDKMVEGSDQDEEKGAAGILPPLPNHR